MFSVWFECKTCRGSFLELSHFLEHKKQDHFDEFQNTQCIIFEERRIQNYETLTVSFSPTPQEIEETNSHEFIDPQIIKIENENIDDRTSSEFQSHTEDQTLNFFETDYTISSDQDFQNEADDFILSNNAASPTHSVNTSSLSENSTATNGTCLDKESCENTKTISDLENKADTAINVNPDAFNSSDLETTQLSIETQRNPFVLLKRLTRQEIHRCSRIESKRTRIVKDTEKSASLHSLRKCSEKNLNTLFKCKLCFDKFNTDLELTAHSNSCILFHSNRKRFYCATCNKIFRTSDSLNKHVIRNHPSELKIVKSKKLKKCHLCSRTFLYEYYLKRHTLTHSTNNKMQKPSSRPFKSQRCRASFTKKYNLPQRPMRHAAEKTINKQSNNKTCPKNSKTKTNKNDPLRLTTSVGTSVSQIFSCDQPHCIKTFRWNYELKRHLATHSTARPFKCPKPNCEKTFKRKDNIRLHTLTVHSDSGPGKRSQVNCKKSVPENSSFTKPPPTQSSRILFKCPISSCPKTFQCKTSISLHMVLHSGLRPFKCTRIDCGLTFRQKSHLKRHLSTHSDAELFKCRKASCDKTFKTSDSLRNHMEVHSDLQLNKCPEVGCKKMFKSKQSLREHLLTQHHLKPLKFSGNETGDETNANWQNTQSAIKIDTASFRCKHPDCGKLFPMKCRLKIHEATHSEKRPFKCPKPSCLKAFKQKKYLVRHVKMHGNSKLGRKNDSKTHNKITEDASLNGTTQDQDAFSTDSTSFKCNKLHCGKQFRDKFNLKRHFDTVHLGKRPFKCPVSTCNYTCTRKNHLKTHLLTKKHADIQN